MASAFNHARHVALLGSLTAALVIAGPRAGSGISLDFALFGALHAIVLALSVEPGAGISALRRAGFVAASALLAWVIARLALLGWRAAAGLGESATPFILLAAASGLGAVAYGLSIRRLLANFSWAGGSAVKWLGAAAFGCAAGVLAGFALARAFHGAALSWLAIPWWLAFSGTLWYIDAK
jgi:hypothetical protein